MEFDFGEDAVLDLGLEAAQLNFSLVHAKRSAILSKTEQQESLARLREILVQEDMVTFARAAVAVLPELKLSPADLAKMEQNNKDKSKLLEDELKDAEENHGEIEVMEALLNIANFHYLTDTKAGAMEKYKKVSEMKLISTGQLIDLTLKQIILGFFWADYEYIEQCLEEGEKLMEKGGDWERRNRLKVYRGLYAMMSRDFKTASENFLSAVATFTCTELCSYSTFIFYTIVTSITQLDRVSFKKNIIDSSQVRAVYSEIDALPEFVNSLYETRYRDFFISIIGIHPKISTDRYISEHTDWFVRELRILSYSQFLESYKSVTTEMMAYEFGISEKFLDKELSRFIASASIQAKIDKAGGVVEASKLLNSHMQYQEVMKQGDLLLNKVQLLSRLLGV
uniref:PCI domain-containing protein n=1 Tax=Aplanochytrium stocchinoi TaxID=215587 RepID=A0A7S3PCP1_9STRA|mmetsp:Transcript_1890/g.2441  ORF Transcript_1890/g.2441 Transcript_1890/m.2441 type:complete len:396 (+) Transcript_1890:17-1204(+)|eukprot:CAMPEP_0204822508 /NCGR_PEP_ID=MMETSP1346-20131115/701_1 /ASSEMBLY_ACC=CAM_ASM_000771 /TAXON_ID=215587 /ORGANISM="Aplanochytrium stocchinoi, Strain GSBS06" /LENGTH=395 /DNA_ID=CAMNT_0051948755 /DNA_START=91 /DNA_END=1278 /DNA_ORIENTATION=+